jgi:cytochrome c peroxidase
MSKGNNKTLPLRIELIRIYSLGVTGFDTPGSLNISEETAHAFSGMKNILMMILTLKTIIFRKQIQFLQKV